MGVKLSCMEESDPGRVPLGRPKSLIPKAPSPVFSEVALPFMPVLGISPMAGVVVRLSHSFRSRVSMGPGGGWEAAHLRPVIWL